MRPNWVHWRPASILRKGIGYAEGAEKQEAPHDKALPQRPLTGPPPEQLPLAEACWLFRCCLTGVIELEYGRAELKTVSKISDTQWLSIGVH